MPHVASIPNARSLGSAFASSIISAPSGLAPRKRRVGRRRTLQVKIGHIKVCDPLDLGTLSANRTGEFGPIGFYVCDIFDIWTAAKDVARN